MYGNLDALSGMMILKLAPLPKDIVKLGVDGVNKIWRDAKLRAVGLKRAKTLVNKAEHSIGCQEAPEAARVELQILLSDYEMYNQRMDELMRAIEEKLYEIPYIDKLLEIKGIGMITICGFIAEVGDIRRFDNPKQLQKLAGYAIVSNDSGKHNGESRISYRGRKRDILICVPRKHYFRTRCIGISMIKAHFTEKQLNEIPYFKGKKT